MGEDIAFIGIGTMGYGMAGNVRKKMSPASALFINDMNSSACDRFIDEFGSFGHIEVVSTAKEAAIKAKTIISMVPGPADVRKVYLDKDQGLIAAPPDAQRLVLESSTIDAQTTREVGEALMKAGVCTYVDTPVSGGVARAVAGTICFMMGHPKPNKPDPIAERIHTTVAYMGDPNKLFFCGSLGAGLVAKISNNYLSGVFCVGIAEAMAIGIESGIDKQVLFDVIRNSSGQSFMGDVLQPVPDLVPTAPSSNDYKPGFRHPLMVKDLTLGIDAGKETGIYPSMALQAVEHFKQAAQDADFGDKDMTSVYQILMRDKKSPSSSR